MTAPASYRDVANTLAPYGLIPRGGFWAKPDDGLPGIATVVMVGNAGADMFAAFSHWRAETQDTEPHQLDRWSRQCIETAADDLGAAAVFPFDGPPYRPFQQWAMRAEPVWPSPLGILIHPRYGLWHAYRGALAFKHTLDLPEQQAVSRPCDSCVARPCLSTCPVEAFADSGETRYDVDTCAGHLRTDAGNDCMAMGCRARRACPVGTEFIYDEAQAAFHMDAFLASR